MDDHDDEAKEAPGWRRLAAITGFLAAFIGMTTALTQLVHALHGTVA